MYSHLRARRAHLSFAICFSHPSASSPRLPGFPPLPRHVMFAVMEASSRGGAHTSVPRPGEIPCGKVSYFVVPRRCARLIKIKRPEGEIAEKGGRDDVKMLNKPGNIRARYIPFGYIYIEIKAIRALRKSPSVELKSFEALRAPRPRYANVPNSRYRNYVNIIERLV